MRGKHAAKVRRRTEAQLAELRATYAQRESDEAATCAAEEEAVQAQIESLRADFDRVVERLAQTARSSARAATEALQEAAHNERVELVALVVEILRSDEGDDEPWSPAPVQLQMAADAFGMDVEALRDVLRKEITA